ncbi:MAG: DUF192 domain-containing protein [Patescibacteria group bacterium]
MSQVIIEAGSHEISFEVEIARTPEEREKGLMYRDFLEPNFGMLFIFEEPKVVNFWMKHTKIPLDIIFIGENLNILHIEEHANPCLDTNANCPLYPSELPIKYALEINAGLVKEKHIEVGVVVTLEV